MFQQFYFYLQYLLLFVYLKDRPFTIIKHQELKFFVFKLQGFLCVNFILQYFLYVCRTGHTLDTIDCRFVIISVDLYYIFYIYLLHIWHKIMVGLLKHGVCLRIFNKNLCHLVFVFPLQKHQNFQVEI